jgi:hypothetical protein
MTENTGILADLGLADVPDGLPEAQYLGNVFNCKVQPYKDVAKGRALIFTYKVNDPDNPMHGETVDEWHSINSFDTPTKKRFLKARLLSLGIPENRMNQFSPQDVIGLAVFFTVKKNGQYTNVTDVRLIEGGDVKSAATGATATAAAPSGVDVDDLL